MSPRARDWTLAVIWFALDRVTKIIASTSFDDAPLVLIPNLLRFSLSHNTGAMFGIARDLHDPWRTILLTIIPLVAIVGISIFLTRIPRREIFARFGLALILGGAAGNVLDRVVYGHVIDFIDVYAGFEPVMSQLVAWFGTNRWPTFNVADMGLVAGACALLIEVFRKEEPEAEGTVPEGAEKDA